MHGKFKDGRAKKGMRAVAFPTKWTSASKSSGEYKNRSTRRNPEVNMYHTNSRV